MWYIKIIGIALIVFMVCMSLCWLSDKIEDLIKKHKGESTHEKQ